MFTILSAATTFGLAYFIYKLISLLRFYIHARRAGFPIIVSPVLSKSIPWMILAQPLLPWFKKYLPAWINDRLDVATHGWEFRRKREFHDRLGNIFAVVTPDECWLWVADPVVGNSVLQRRNEFPQAPAVGRILGLFGPNVFCTNGDEWKRHRRMFSANLDERISKIVWNESCQQACDMLKYVLKNPGNRTLDGLKSVAINVIGQAGLNQGGVWSPDVRHRTGEATSGKAAFWETLLLATEMIIEAALLPTKVMKLPFMPPALRLMGHHMERSSGYMEEVLNEERKASSNVAGRRSNFLSFLLKLSDEEKHAGHGGFSLTDAEISGNLFVFSTAGFETTANTMGFAIIHLAVHPELQDWVREELQTLDQDPLTWNYEEVFPKCRRTLALMLETLRHFPPVLHSTRAVFEPQEIVDANGSHILTPPMDVMVCQLSMQLDPAIWGADAGEFRPSRWLDESGQLIVPPKGSYIPWSGGPRICPGIKMAQVEFVATMATLFRSARCEPLPTAGAEKPEARRERLQQLTRDSVSKLTLQLRNASDVELQWTIE
ncbi:hypothetical protein AJ78_08463 [Emergomyces pasteurianus Ep9510]|uniref:Cytochrome P450 monooxygenase n=1 Tax=Emergomyces pasteurianus Ep9510 TaxID=1447872 RepID=A0A1J9P3X3_9EURO|nr:hypothetical protein AJ78_08463 [Emergomyces pasteurianus Ep9510]